MPTVEVIPGLFVDDAMFEASAAGVARFAPTVSPLTYETFTTAARWANIPNDQGELSKSQMPLVRTAEFTAILNVWHAEDSRGSGKPMPHNHPWITFTAHLLHGEGYEEDRYCRTAVDETSGRADVVAELGVQHASPTENILDHGVFHEIPHVLEPGRTLSLMICGRGRRGDWCHLDVDSGELLHDQPVPHFDRMFTALNPHLR